MNKNARCILTAWLSILPAATAAQVIPGQPGPRDSAGVRIVDIPAGRLRTLPEWRVDPRPLSIGEALGAPEYTLHLASNPWRLADGRIVVANQQSELRFFDSTGKYLGTTGRKGSGPGEFQQLWNLYRSNRDTLRVYDVPTSRVSIFDPNGRLVRTMQMTAQPNALGLAWLPDGSALYLGYTMPAGGRLGVYLDSMPVHRMNPDGTAGPMVLRVPGSWRNGVSAQSFTSIRLAGDPLLAPGPAGAVYAHGDALGFLAFTATGRLATMVRVAQPRVRLSAKVIADDIAANRPPAQARPPEGGGAPPEPLYATFEPVIDRVRMDNTGAVWLRRWAPPGTRSAEWVVFTAGGEPLGRLTLPANLRVFDIGTEYILGIAVDEEGVQFIHQYRLHRR